MIQTTSGCQWYAKFSISKIIRILLLKCVSRSSWSATTLDTLIPGQIVEKEKDTFNENENQEMDDPDFDPMGEDLYAVLDEHEFKFNRSTKVSQKEADLLMQVRGRSLTTFTRWGGYNVLHFTQFGLFIM